METDVLLHQNHTEIRSMLMGHLNDQKHLLTQFLKNCDTALDGEHVQKASEAPYVYYTAIHTSELKAGGRVLLTAE